MVLSGERCALKISAIAGQTDLLDTQADQRYWIWGPRPVVGDAVICPTAAEAAPGAATGLQVSQLSALRRKALHTHMHRFLSEAASPVPC